MEEFRDAENMISVLKHLEDMLKNGVETPMIPDYLISSPFYIVVRYNLLPNDQALAKKIEDLHRIIIRRFGSFDAREKKLKEDLEEIVHQYEQNGKLSRENPTYLKAKGLLNRRSLTKCPSCDEDLILYSKVIPGISKVMVNYSLCKCGKRYDRRGNFVEALKIEEEINNLKSLLSE